METLFKNIHIIGIGLIGGSLALDLKAIDSNCNIYGIDTNENNLAKALELGIIDKASHYSELKLSDLIIISIPVDKSLLELPKILDHISDTSLVLDVGSTKYALCKSVENHKKRRNYLATHPIAGTEFSGPDAAIRGLFNKKTNIICEVEKTAFKLQEKGLKLFSKLGMRIRYMNPEAHDKHIAYVSHLSHISSFMLGKTVIEMEKNERDIFDMAGSGFESTVRLAKSSPDMWTPIFKQNKSNVIETLTKYINNLQDFKQSMVANDFENVYEVMKNTNRIKDILKGIE